MREVGTSYNKLETTTSMTDKQSIAVAVMMVLLLVVSFGKEIEAQNCKYIGPCETIAACVSECVGQGISNKGFCVPDGSSGKHCCCEVPN